MASCVSRGPARVTERALARFRRLSPMAPVVAAALLSGCVSLDPTADFEQAMTFVEERSGWRPDWNAPWSADVAAWDGVSPLTADQAVTIALQNNRTIRAALEGIASARADLVQSGLLPNPVLSASFGPAIGGEGGAASVSISFVQQLTDLWLRPARMDAAATTLREQVLGVSDGALRLVADVRQAHARLVYAHRGAALTRSHIDLVDRSIEVARQRMAAGEASRLDVNRLRQLRFALQAELTQQELDLARQRRAFLEILGRADAGGHFRVEDVAARFDRWSDELGEQDVIELASRQRLDVAAARVAYETARHELRVANLGSIPEIEGGLAYERDEDRRDELGPEIGIEIPIFDTNRARVAKAMSDLRRAEIESDQIRQRAVTQARSAWLDVRANLELVDFFQESVIALARDNLRLAERALKAGQIDMTVVLETQREVILAEFQLNQLEENAAVSFNELEYAVGGRLSHPSQRPDEPDEGTADLTGDHQGAAVVERSRPGEPSPALHRLKESPRSRR